jgi:hypothetical protein
VGEMQIAAWRLDVLHRVTLSFRFVFISLIKAWNVKIEKDLRIHVFKLPHFTGEEFRDQERDKVTFLRSCS